MNVDEYLQTSEDVLQKHIGDIAYTLTSMPKMHRSTMKYGRFENVNWKCPINKIAKTLKFNYYNLEQCS